MHARFLHAGDTALVVELGDRVERALSERILRLAARVRGAHVPGVIEIVPTYRSLMIHYDPLVTGSARLIAAIETLLHESLSETRPKKLWRIPACYASAHGPDLAEVAERTGLSVRRVVELHTATRFHVYMLGFVPGYAYLGDLPDALALPRREDPRVRVPAGSIAIAANMTAVYPIESPGGWHLIGATPVRLFDVRAPQPALLAPGDAVCFEAVDEVEFERVRDSVARGTYYVPRETIAA